MIYLDSSALIKLALAEPETTALSDYIAKRGDQALVSSSLHRAEVLRAIWQAEPGALPRAQRMIRRISIVSLSHDLLDNAATQPPGGLSTGLPPVAGPVRRCAGRGTPNTPQSHTPRASAPGRAVRS